MTALETLRPELTAHVEAVRAIGRRAAESVRDLGVALAAAKGDCRHGEWLPFLAAAGVPERFAQRAIRYSKLLPKSGQPVGFAGAVQAARRGGAAGPLPDVVRG